MMAIRDTTATACQSREQDLVLYYYGELSEPDRGQVITHVQACGGCSLYLKQLETLLPITRKVDDPPQAFWDDYSRELRRKIARVKDRKSWRRDLASFFQPWTVPAFATAALVVLAVTLTLGKGFWSSGNAPPVDEALMEILPVAENLDFFKTMEVLDAMDLLEEMGRSSGGSA
jgi:hypothetical protein